MKNQSSNQKETAVIAVPSVDVARKVLLESGLFDACPGSNNTLIDPSTGVQVRLVPFSTKN